MPSIIDKAPKGSVNLFIILICIKMLKLNPITLRLSRFYLPLWFNFPKILKSYNFGVIFKPGNKFKFISTKSPVSELCKRGICNVHCNICHLSYNDQTEKDFEKRLRQHFWYIIKQRISQLSIAKHNWESDQSVNFQQDKIIFHTDRVLR